MFGGTFPKLPIHLWGKVHEPGAQEPLSIAKTDFMGSQIESHFHIYQYGIT